MEQGMEAVIIITAITVDTAAAAMAHPKLIVRRKMTHTTMVAVWVILETTTIINQRLISTKTPKVIGQQQVEVVKRKNNRKIQVLQLK
jgi:hypothetical protein